MADNLSIGKKGENLAAEFLTKKGYQILRRNYRYRRGEIDLIAKRNNIIIFVEVKYRSGTSFGFPEDFVDNSKEEMVLKTAEFFLEEENWNGDIRFDIIAISGNEIRHFLDAFA